MKLSGLISAIILTALICLIAMGAAGVSLSSSPSPAAHFSDHIEIQGNVLPRAQASLSLPAPILEPGQELLIPVLIRKEYAEAEVIREGISPSKQIALTFDAGWLHDQTMSILAVLEDYDVQCTFFLRGLWVKEHPELAREISLRGHDVENHSLTHGHLTGMGEAEVAREVAETTEIIQKVTGISPHLFRPPFGEYNDSLLEILGRQGYPYSVMWTVDSLDWTREINGIAVTVDYLVDRVLSKATDDGIVLMHVGGFQTVNALPDIIAGLQEQGYTLVKVSDMLPPVQDLPATVSHTVKAGECLYGIAKAYGTSVGSIIEANTLLTMEMRRRRLNGVLQ